MTKNMCVILSCMLLGTIALSGCGTVPKKFKEEVSGIRTRVDTLESRVEGVEGRQTDLERMAQEEAARRVKSNIGTRTKTRSPAAKAEIREIQTLLKNAGYYTGRIDGVKGRVTRKSIREFQRANGLSADGIVGPKTLEALSRYTTSAQGMAQEKSAVK